MGGGQSTEQEQERSPVEQLYGRLFKVHQLLVLGLETMNWLSLFSQEMKKTSNSDQTSSADSSDVDVFKVSTD